MNVFTSCECVDNILSYIYNYIVNTSLKKTCSFFGHRKITNAKTLSIELHEIIENLILDNYTDFYFGGFGEFDELCYNIVTELKASYPNINRIYCLTDIRHLRKSKRPKYLKDEYYEQYVYLEPSFDYWYTRIYYRNCEIINISDLIIFFVENRENSGAYKIYKYAKIKHKHYINLFRKK